MFYFFCLCDVKDLTSDTMTLRSTKASVRFWPEIMLLEQLFQEHESSGVLIICYYVLCIQMSMLDLEYYSTL